MAPLSLAIDIRELSPYILSLTSLWLLLGLSNGLFQELTTASQGVAPLTTKTFTEQNAVCLFVLCYDMGEYTVMFFHYLFTQSMTPHSALNRCPGQDVAFTVSSNKITRKSLDL